MNIHPAEPQEHGFEQVLGQKRPRAGQQGGQPTDPHMRSLLIDGRLPAFTTGCLTRLLDAVVDDGVVPASQLVQVSVIHGWMQSIRAKMSTLS